MKYPKSVYLTFEEADILDQITHETKMDCWFWLESDCDLHLPEGLVDALGGWYKIIDLESGKKIGFQNALNQLCDGLFFNGKELENVNLTTAQTTTFLQMLARNGSFYSKSEEVK